MDTTFTSLPKSADELIGCEAFDLSTPHRTAALFVIALCAYPHSQEATFEMIDVLRGPAPLTLREKQFIRDRLGDKGDYLGQAYLAGATPANDYAPSEPYVVSVEENTYSYAEEGYARLFLATEGADSPRPITLRKKGDAWYLYQFAGVLSAVRKPISDDPWR